MRRLPITSRELLVHRARRGKTTFRDTPCSRRIPGAGRANVLPVAVVGNAMGDVSVNEATGLWSRRPRTAPSRRRRSLFRVRVSAETLVETIAPPLTRAEPRMAEVRPTAHRSAEAG